MTNGKMAAFLFEVGVILCVLGMVLGPLNIITPSLATSVAGAVLALFGLPFAFRSWRELPPLEKKERQAAQTEEYEAAASAASNEEQERQAAPEEENPAGAEETISAVREELPREASISKEPDPAERGDESPRRKA